MVRLTVRELAGVLHQPLFQVRRQLQERGQVSGISAETHGIRDETGRLSGVRLSDTEAERLGVEAATSQPFTSDPAPKRRVHGSQTDATDADFEVLSQPEDVKPEHVAKGVPASSQETRMVRKNAAQEPQKGHQESQKEQSSTATSYFILGGIVTLGIVMPALARRGKD